jgi:hypothetical protein
VEIASGDVRRPAVSTGAIPSTYCALPDKFDYTERSEILDPDGFLDIEYIHPNEDTFIGTLRDV